MPLTSAKTAAVKTGYKQTEVGVIPDEWNCINAELLGRFRGGNGFPLIQQGRLVGDYPFFKVSDMNNEGNETFMVRANNRISEEIRKRLGATVFSEGSIVFAKVGAAVFLERKKILSQPSCIDNNMAAYTLDGKQADVRFIHAQLLKKRFGALVEATALPALNGRQLGEMPLAVPPIGEQRAIANALIDTDDYISTLRKLIAKKRDLKQASMQQLLSGKKRLAGFKDEWAQKLLGDLFDFGGGYSASRAQLSSEGHRYLHYGDIHTSNKVLVDVDSDHGDLPRLRVTLSKVAPASLLCDGDVVFVDASEDAAGTSKHVVVKNEANLPFISGLHTIVAKRKTDELRREYLCHCFQTHEIRRQFLFYAVGTKVSGVSKGKIGKIELPVPSPAEQTAIAEVLSDMDSEIEALEDKLSKVRQIKQGMMQELLTGRIRLV